MCLGLAPVAGFQEMPWTAAVSMSAILSQVSLQLLRRPQGVSMLAHAAGRLGRVTTANAFRRIHTAPVCQGIGSHVSDNDPEVLETQKEKSLKGEQAEGTVPVKTHVLPVCKAR